MAHQTKYSKRGEFWKSMWQKGFSDLENMYHTIKTVMYLFLLQLFQFCANRLNKTQGYFTSANIWNSVLKVTVPGLWVCHHGSSCKANVCCGVYVNWRIQRCCVSRSRKTRNFICHVANYSCTYMLSCCHNVPTACAEESLEEDKKYCTLFVSRISTLVPQNTSPRSY